MCCCLPCLACCAPCCAPCFFCTGTSCVSGESMAPLLLLALPAGCCACVAAKRMMKDNRGGYAPPNPYYYPPTNQLPPQPPQLRMAPVSAAKFTNLANIPSIMLQNVLRQRSNAINGDKLQERALLVRNNELDVMRVDTCNISRGCFTEMGSYELKICLPQENTASFSWPGQAEKQPQFNLHPTLTCTRSTTSNCGATLSEVTIKRENHILGYIQDPSSILNYGFTIYDANRNKILMVKRRAFFKPNFDITLHGTNQIVSTFKGTLTDSGIDMEVKLNDLQASNKILVAMAAIYINQFYLQQIFLGTK